MPIQMGCRVALAICLVSSMTVGFQPPLVHADAHGSRFQAPLVDAGAHVNGRIFFARSTSSVRTIWSVREDGAGMRQITDGAGGNGDSEPAISPDGSDLAFVRHLGTDDADLWVVASGGGTARRLTNNPNFESGPAWSPDGLRLAFAREELNSDPSDIEFPLVPAIWILDIASGTELRLTQGGDPFWSPDGRQLVFIRSGNVYIINADGSGLMELYRHTGQSHEEVVGDVFYSPDGQWIYLISEETHIRDRRIRPDGSGLQYTGWNADSATISPDSNRVAIAYFHEVFSVKLDGSDRRDAFASSIAEPVAFEWIGLHGIAWSRATLPSEPRHVTLTPGPGPRQVSVRWAPPVDDGGAVPTSWTIALEPGPVMVTVGGAATEAVLPWLHNGTAYTARVAVTTDAGTSPFSTPSGPAFPQPGAAARDTALACPTGGVPEDGFTDVPAESVHEAAVDCAAWWGVAAGKTPTTYDPRARVTRAQMATFIARTLAGSGVALSQTAADRFPDDGGSPHEGNINALAEAGVVSGRADGTYGPDESVDRAQMATFLVRAYELALGNPLPTPFDYFNDDSESVHQRAINAAAEAGFTAGGPDGGYRPTDSVTRDQMASFLTRKLDRAVEDRLASPAGGQF